MPTWITSVVGDMYALRILASEVLLSVTYINDSGKAMKARNKNHGLE